MTAEDRDYRDDIEPDPSNTEEYEDWISSQIARTNQERTVTKSNGTESTAIVTAQPQVPSQPNGYSREQLDLLKRTIARDTTDDEFSLFVNTARRLGLDPFARQIFAVKRWDSRAGREVMSIQVSIDGFRATAARTNELDGQDGPFWCGEDGKWRDVWLDQDPPSAAKVCVFRKGCSRPFTGIATFDSYVQRTKDGKPNSMWTRFPDTMIAKCAEALALRKAFPSELSNVYTPDEMGQADNPPTEISPSLSENSAAVQQAIVTAGVRPAKPVTPPVDETALEDIALDLIADINECKSPDAVRALASRFKALPKGSRAREQAAATYNKRIADTSPPVAA